MDKFTDKKTVLGAKTFTNLIATLDPKAEGRLVLACHIDSKIKPGKKIITKIYLFFNNAGLGSKII